MVRPRSQSAGRNQLKCTNPNFGMMSQGNKMIFQNHFMPLFMIIWFTIYYYRPHHDAVSPGSVLSIKVEKSVSEYSASIYELLVEENPNP